LQEANEALLLYLKSPLEVSAKEKRAESNESVKGEPRPEGQFIGVRGPDPKSGLMICARASLALGIRLLIFHRIYDGAYKVPGKKAKTLKGAVSRIMIASLKMRCVSFRGRGVDGDDAEDLGEIRIANAHLHFRTAKRELQSGAAAYKRFWDLLAKYIAEFRPSLLCGDFNMALLAVIPELRARSFQVFFGRVVLLAEQLGDACEGGLMRHLPHRTLPRDSHVLRCFCVWAPIPRVARKLLHDDGDPA